MGLKNSCMPTPGATEPEPYTLLGCQVRECSPQPVPAAEITAPSKVSVLLVCVITPSPRYEVVFHHFLFLQFNPEWVREKWNKPVGSEVVNPRRWPWPADGMGWS